MSSLSPIHSFNPIKIDRAFERFAHSPTEKKVAAVALAVFAALAVIGVASGILAGTGLLAGSLVILTGAALGAGALAAYIASVVFQFATVEKAPVIETQVREIRPQKEDMLQLRQDVIKKGREVALPQGFIDAWLSGDPNVTTSSFLNGLQGKKTETAFIDHIKDIDLLRLSDIKNEQGQFIIIDCGKEKVVADDFDNDFDTSFKKTFIQDVYSLFSFYGHDKNGLPSSQGPFIREIVVENKKKYLYMTMVPREQVVDDSTNDGNRFLEVMPAYTLRMNLEVEDAPVQMFQLDGIRLVDK